VAIRWLEAALEDLRDLRAYIALDDPAAASEVSRRIRAAAGSLLEFPARGRVGRVPGTRELVVARTPYLISYRVLGATIEIQRVLHGAQRWPQR
jgi:addiction module RelE/StbE family toxin